jgi:hypothetical protein
MKELLQHRIEEAGETSNYFNKVQFMSALASIFQDTGELEKAEALFTSCLEIRSKDQTIIIQILYQPILIWD